MTNIKLAQKAAHMTIAMLTQGAVVTQIENHTEIDTDGNIPVAVGALVVGELTARQTDRVINPLIEKAAVRITSWKNRKAVAETVVESVA